MVRDGFVSWEGSRYGVHWKWVGRIVQVGQRLGTVEIWAKRKLLEPGYWGSLEDEELEIIQRALENNPKLSFAWGFQPVQKSRAPDAIRRVAMWGDPKDREINTKVIRSSRMRVS